MWRDWSGRCDNLSLALESQDRSEDSNATFRARLGLAATAWDNNGQLNQGQKNRTQRVLAHLSLPGTQLLVWTLEIV